MDPELVRALFGVLFVGFLGVRLAFRRIWTHIPRQGVFGLRERLLTSGMAIAIFLPSLLYIAGWLGFADVAVASGVRATGFGVGLGSLGLLTWVHATLGANFSPRLELRDEHTLIEAGPYRWVRHPMYTCGFLLMFGETLLTGNLAVGLAPAALLAVIVWIRVRDEEAMLAGRFGAAWTAYTARTGRLIPRVF